MARKATYAAFCADFERKLEDRIRVAQAREGVFANILGDPAPELERALADNPDTERLRFIARYVTDQYQGEVGGEPAIRSTIDALRARGDRETLDRFAATLIARRKPSYLSFIDLTGRWAAEAEQAATAFVQSVRDAEVAFASVFDHADHGLAALLAAVETDPATVARGVLAANRSADIDPIRLSAVADEITADADRAAGFDSQEAKRRDFARIRETGSIHTTFEDAHEAAYLGALARAWRQGTAAHRRLITTLFARIFAEGRRRNEKLIELRRVLVAEAEQTGDHEALRVLCVAFLALPARRLVDALHTRDEEATERLAFLSMLYEARITAARGNPARLAEFEAEIGRLKSGEKSPAPPILERGKIDGRRFWELVAEAATQAPPAEIRVERLIDRLSCFSTPGIKGFERELGRRLVESCTWELWALADALLKGCGDDAFEYFRCWLILQGEDVLTRVLKDPDAAWRWLHVAELPQCESLLGAASEAMVRRGLDPSKLPPRPHRRDPKGKRFDANKLTQRFPSSLRGADTAG